MIAQNLDPRRVTYWIRISLLALAFVGVLASIRYFQSGRLASDPAIQAVMGGEEPMRTGKVVTDHPSTSSKDR